MTDELFPAPQHEAVVRRSVEVDADVDEVWRAVTDPAERTLWLDDPDALARHIRIDEATPHERFVWTWWRPGDEGDASTVSVVLTPVDGGTTRVDVTERLVAVGAVAPNRPRAIRLDATARLPEPVPVGDGVGAGAGATMLRRSPAWVRCARDRWDRRILGLELLFVAARVAVA